MKGLIGKKLGMTQIFENDGRRVSVTVVQAGPCTVTCLRSQEKDGYSAMQLGFGRRSPRKMTKPLQGQLKAAGFEKVPPLCVREIRLKNDSDLSIGQVLKADVFAENEYVDISGRTKGRGFQGVVKRYDFGGGRASHGGSWMRKTGSIGMCVSPGKVYKGRKMPGQMGGVRRTCQNLRIVQVRPDDDVILVEGAVPGPSGGLVEIRPAVKK